MLKKGLDLSKLAPAQVDLSKLKSKLSSGNAVLITGAGFSLDCENITGGNPPLAGALSEKFCEEFGLPITDDLKYTSDVCITLGDKEDVLQVLKDNYSLVAASQANIDICSIPWRRIYTTNYDNSIELSYLANKKSIESLSLLDKPQDYIKHEKAICLHLNGSIQNAAVDDLDTKIKLSDASYMSADFFLDSKWRNVFNRDVEHCSALVFVGYSLYDFDIEKVLNDRPHLADKTYFVVHDGASHQLTYKLSKYGHVTQIGTSGFGELVKEVIVDKDDVLMPSCFTKRVVNEEDSNLDDVATQLMLLFGKYTNTDVDTVVRKGFDVPFMFERSVSTEILTHLMDKKHVFIQSDLGNGKSVLMSHIASSATLYGQSVWEMTNFEDDACKDLDILANLAGDHLVIIDDISDQKEFFDYFTAMLPSNITLLLSDRSVSSFSNIQQFADSGVPINVFSLNELLDTEIEQLISILDDQNLWKQYTGWSRAKKVNLIREGYNSQLSNVLLELLKSPDIKDRVLNLLTELTSEPKYKKTLFALALCDVFNIRKDPVNISDIAGNEEILTAKFRDTDAFTTLFSVSSDSTILAKSSILSLFIINNILTDSYVVENCLEIMGRIDNRDEHHLKTLHSKLRTFSNVEKLIPQKQASLNNYFVELKRRCTWLTRHPHFWVQYAMCRLSFGDTSTAQQHLDSAYEFAALRTNGSSSYHTENIDTQQARLYLMEVTEGTISEREKSERFEKAHALLLGVKNDNKRFRQVLKYEDVFDCSYSAFGKGKQANFEHACKRMLQDAQEAKAEATATERINFIVLSIEKLTSILESIKTTR
ncbi:SIR2 family protein [Vibrio sonorensis]|uniref:SIR2 family protein n=1 Tax=Vibrio sonorensis TaxID=1004316 RepID=UPI0008D95EB2|nr:SIR2 family protein [Vibrio sonorensis]